MSNDESILKELKILFVEDEVNISKLLKDALADYFYSFTVASDGLEGLEKFKNINPDIVITDIMMPNLDGLEMTKEIRKINEDIPIIVLSAFSDKEKLLKAIDIGITKYFIKPFDPEEVLEYLVFIANKLNKNRIVCLNEDFSFDTNGSNPNLLKTLLEQKLLNFVAIDFKGTKDKFYDITKSNYYNKFLESLHILEDSDIEYEVRTTLHEDLLDEDDINEMQRVLIDNGYHQNYYIQNFLETENLSNLKSSEKIFDKSKLLSNLNIVWRN